MIATATNTVVETIQVGAAPLGVAIGPQGKLVSVTNSDSGSVSVIATTTNTVVKTIPTGAESSPMAWPSAPMGTTPT